MLTCTLLRVGIFLFGLMAGVLAQQEHLPDCAINCLESSLEAQPECTPTDTSCICTNKPLNAAIEACIGQSCSIKQILVTQNITATMCERPVRDRAQITNVLCGATGSLALLVVILRTSNALYIGAFGRDDACALGAGIFLIIDNAVTFPAGPAGYGLDIWTVPFENITFIFKMVWLMQIFYWPVSAFTKLAFLFFYLRIFPSPTLRKCIYVTMALTICYWITFQLGNIFYCWPIPMVWNGWDGEHEGKCLDINIFMITATTVNILLDAIIIVLPVPDLLKLTLSWRKKTGLVAMFAVGIFALIVSILRIESILSYSKSQNGTYDNVPATYWSTTELNVGVFCMCMPAIRRFLSTHLPRMFATTHDSKGRATYYGNDIPGDSRKRRNFNDSLLNDTVIIKSVTPKVASSGDEDDEMRLVNMTKNRRYQEEA